MFQFLLLIVDIDIIFQCLISDHIVPIFFHSIFKTYHCVFKANNRTEQMFFFPGSEISEIQICQVSEFLQGKMPLLAAPQGKIFKTGVYYLNIINFTLPNVRPYLYSKLFILTGFLFWYLLVKCGRFVKEISQRRRQRPNVETLVVL